jgi:hypothetical protein
MIEVMQEDRERQEAAVRNLLDDFLETVNARFPDGILLGTCAIVAEIAYTPEGETIEDLLPQDRPLHSRTEIWYRCTDSRTWLQAGLFRRAMLVAESSDGEDDGE